ncbi:MAG: 4'-phosphopantetheinyl transferase superfamily protein [Proteobacteria bacterium]|nr:4'-phosphopantetheinyl transferase superfamily protein [Pseudomonadota bacterium]
MTSLQRLEAVPENIDAWLLEFAFTSAQLAHDWPLLSATEQLRARSFHHYQDRIRFVSARAALKRLLAERVGTLPDRLTISITASGKPYLAQHAEIQFNLSHAGSFALIALSSAGRVGIDIERCNRDVTGLMHCVLSPLERTRACWPEKRFIDLWVAKEAVLKALGLGIAENLQDISVLPEPGSRYCIAHEHPDWGNIRAWPIEVPEDYAAALALVH